MIKILTTTFLLTFVSIFGCSDDSKDKNTNTHLADTAYLVGKYYRIGLQNLNDSSYYSALENLKKVRKEESLYDSAQIHINYIENIIKIETENKEKVNNETRFLFFRIDNILKSNIYDKRLLFEELIESGCIEKDDVIEYVSEGDYLRDQYFDEFTEEYPNYDGSNSYNDDYENDY